MRVLLPALLCFACPLGAQAVVITRGGTPLPGAGLGSAVPGVTIESFDRTGAGGGCGPNLLTLSGDYSITNTSRSGVRAAPAGDRSCYVAVPDDRASTQRATLAFPTLGRRIDYLGLYWGSMDNYNSLEFLDSSGARMMLGSFGPSLSGDEVRAASARPGDQVAPGANAYVNIFFDPGQSFSSLRIISTGRAFEFDNIAWRAEASEPAVLTLFGLGAALLGLRQARRRGANRQR